MNSHLLILRRDLYSNDTTLGDMSYIQHDSIEIPFGHSLEDTVRANGIKVYGDTAIPATEIGEEYFVDIRISPKYGEVVVFYTHKELLANGEFKYILNYKGIRFEYILGHGGNHHKDTMGCVLVAKTRNDANMSIQGSLKKELVALVKKLQETCDVRLRVINKPQKK